MTDSENPSLSNKQIKLSKPESRALEEPIFRTKINGVPVRDSLVAIVEPIVQDLTDLYDLLKIREIQSKDFLDYLFRSPEYEPMNRKLCELAAQLANKTDFSTLTFAKLTKESSLLMQTTLRVLDQDPKEADGRVHAISTGVGTSIMLFVVFYLEDMFLKLALSQIRKKVTSEKGVAVQLKLLAANLSRVAHLSKKGQRLGINNGIKNLADHIENADGTFIDTLGLMEKIGSSMNVQPDSERLLKESAQSLEEGNRPAPLFSHIKTSEGTLQVEIAAFPESAYEHTPGLIQRSFCLVRFNIVPKDHVGHYSPPPTKIKGGIVGMYYPMNASTGKLFVNGTMGQTSLCLMIGENAAKALEAYTLRLVKEGLDGIFEIGKIVPERTTLFGPVEVEDKKEVKQAIPTVTPEPVQERAKQKQNLRLPRDMTGTEFEAILRRMNRAYFRSKGVSEDQLEKKSEPRPRVKGSHAIVFYAPTGKVSPVTIQRQPLPVNAVATKLRNLGIEVEEFMKYV